MLIIYKKRYLGIFLFLWLKRLRPVVTPRDERLARKQEGQNSEVWVIAINDRISESCDFVSFNVYGNIV